MVNGELQVIDRRIAEQTAKVDLSKSLQTPDIAAGGAFVYDAEPEFRYGWRVSFGVTLPIFTTHKSAVLFEEGTLTRLQAERAIVLARISGGIGAALARATAARERMTTVRGNDSAARPRGRAAGAGGVHRRPDRTSGARAGAAAGARHASARTRRRARLSARARRSRTRDWSTHQMTGSHFRTAASRAAMTAALLVLASCRGTPVEQIETEAPVPVVVETAKVDVIRARH